MVAVEVQELVRIVLTRECYTRTCIYHFCERKQYLTVCGVSEHYIVKHNKLARSLEVEGMDASCHPAA